ncbi:GMC oxidoreductase-domain-containing protein [Kalaharituber pfeilii]|nr:GMC oxidoreductase-domain-containing protein [Kalaharituber pfeilii]
MQTQEAWDGAGIPRVDPEIHSPERYGKKNFHQFEFEDFSGKDEVDYDVVIVGSGAGAGVAAKNISEWAKERGTNLRILVVEKGEYIPHEQLTLTEKEAFARMYEKGMMGPTEEGMNIMAGATFGGGTMINWAAALRTPGMVRREWAEEYGLGMYLSREFIDALERVEKRMGVSAEHCVHSGPNRALKEGAKRLGYAVHDVPQNTGGAPHACGYCANGCRYGEKQGAPNSWLVDASKAGAKFAQRVEVEKVIFEAENTGSGGWFGALETGSRRAKKKVAGLECWVGDRHAGPRRRLRINTRKVIISAGSLHSPVILLRSGLKNPEIGANFRCHPATYMYAFFPHDIPMNAITGPIISTVITETASLSPPPHTHYGSRVEIASPQAALSYGFFPWLDPIFWRTSIARYSHLAVAFSMARDGRRAPTAVRNSSGVVLPGSSELGPELFCGRIKLDPETGGPSVSYVLRKEDRESIVQGLLVGAESFLAAGAKEIVMPLFQGKPFVVPDGHSGITEGLNVPGFREWLVEIRRLGAVANSFPIGTGHQMGTCRMSAKSWEDGDECGDVAGASTAEWIGYLANAAGRVLVGGGSGKAKGVGRVKPGVVDVEGRVFGVEGLWVMDASVFPGATAVNPMLSVMSVSDVLSRKLVGRWEKEGTWDTAAAAARTAPA